jgi:membrane protease subunit HflC
MSARIKPFSASLVLAVIVVVLGWRSFAVIDETELAVVTMLGRPTRTISDAGIILKSPIESVLRFEKRLLLYNPPASEFLTRDKKNLVVNSAICWRIEDPLRFLQSAGTITGAEMRIHDLVWASLAAEMGTVELGQLVGIEAETLETQAILDTVRRTTGEMARQRLGVEVVDVQIKRLTFPQQNTQSVFARMRAERERIAREYRAQGEEQAIVIRAEADRERALVLAEAYREAEKLKGEGDAEATRIYAAAHRKNPELYRFVRTLDAYRKILDAETTVIMSSDSKLFEVLYEGGPGRGLR